MDHTLHENGAPCLACELRREARDPWDETPVPCNTCGGSGRLAFSAQDVVRKSARWARDHYWPEREKRWAIQNGAI